tara:strand:- start:208 stop:432 length:225 start_codon:yes stop_codon:yes gene_type:complete
MTQETKTTVTNLGEAISVLVQAVHIGQSKGVYSFEDSSKVASALEFLNQTAATAKAESNGAPIVQEEVDATVEK